MISKQETLKLIKEKVDARPSNKIKLKKPFWCNFVTGIFKHKERRRIVTLVKDGNSTNWIDDGYSVRNINVLDTKDLHKIMWQLITEREKKEIAYSDFVERMNYLTE